MTSTQNFIEIEDIKDSIVLLRGGGAVVVLKTTGVNFELLSENEKDAVIYGFSALINSISFPIQIIVSNQKKDIAPYIARINAEKEHQSNPKLKEQIEKYRDFVQDMTKSNSVLEKNFYIAISFYGRRDFEEVKRSLFPRRDNLLKQLERVGLKGKSLQDHELVALFHNIFNPDVPLSESAELDSKNFKNSLAPQSVEVDFSFTKIDSHYYRTLFTMDYPRYVSPNWLAPIIWFDHTLDICFSIFPAESGDVLSDLKRKVGEMEATLASDYEQGRVEDPKLKAALEDALLLQEELAKGTERFFQFGFYITIEGANKEELDRVTKSVQATLASLLVIAKPATLQQEDGFKTTIPFGTDRLLLTRNMDTTSLASTFPFTTSSLSANEGILYGLNKYDESLIIFDRFTLENANSVVFGKSGGGKSYLIKLEVLRSLMFGQEIIIIDPEREYEKLAQTVGGVFLSFSTTAPISINPFDLAGGQDLPAKISFLHGLFKIIMGELTPQETASLDRVLVNTYKKFGTNPPPIMEDFYTMLLQDHDPVSQELATRLERFIKGSLAGIFNQRSNVNIENPFTVFSIRDLEEEIRPLAMYIILDYIWTKIRKSLKKRILVIDEAWYLMKHEDSASFVFSIAKRARKYFLGLTTITQDIEDFLSSTYGKPILSNSSIQILLKQSPASIDLITKTFYLSEGEKHYLLSAGIGEGLFFAGQNHAAIKVISAPFEHEVITSSPQELLKMKGLPAQAGENEWNQKLETSEI